MTSCDSPRYGLTESAISLVKLNVLYVINPDTSVGDTHVWARNFAGKKTTFYALESVIFFWILFNLDHDSIRMFCATGRVFLFMGESFLHARALSLCCVHKQLFKSLWATTGRQSSCHTF
jgi:hypothetical protein